jgi:hypothetical protein
MVTLEGTVTALVLALKSETARSAMRAWGIETVPVDDDPSLSGFGLNEKLKEGVDTVPLPETFTTGDPLLETETAFPESAPTEAVPATRTYTGVPPKVPPL